MVVLRYKRSPPGQNDTYVSHGIGLRGAIEVFLYLNRLVYEPRSDAIVVLQLHEAWDLKKNLESVGLHC